MTGLSPLRGYGTYDNLSRNYNIFDNLTMVRGRHTLKFGFTYNYYSSDANAISAVVVRDILPALRGPRSALQDRAQLRAGRICTHVFLAGSMMIALSSDHFGGVMGLLLLWYAALVGAIAIPMLLGTLRIFRRSGSAAAILSWAAGATAFALIKIRFRAAHRKPAWRSHHNDNRRWPRPLRIFRVCRSRPPTSG